MKRTSLAVGAFTAAAALVLSACGGDSSSDGSSGGESSAAALEGRGPITLVQGKDVSGFIQGVLVGWNADHPDEQARLI